MSKRHVELVCSLISCNKSAPEGEDISFFVPVLILLSETQLCPCLKVLTEMKITSFSSVTPNNSSERRCSFQDPRQNSPNVKLTIENAEDSQSQVHSEPTPYEIYRSSRRGSTVNDSVRNCCVTSKLCWWEPSVDESLHTVDFCLDTSLHGLKYIGQPQRHLTERLFWLIAFLIGSFVAGWLISDIWIKYVNSPVLVSFQSFETNIGEIPFPAITICNVNKVLKSKAEQIMREADGPEGSIETLIAQKELHYLDHVCSSSKSFSKRFNFSSTRGTVDPVLLAKTKILADGDDEQSDVAGFLQTASQRCTDMLTLCMWQDEIRNCSDLLNPIETDLGKCCSFNLVSQSLLHHYTNDSRDDPKEIADWAAWDLDKDGLLIKDNYQREFPRRQQRAGKTSGLSILLDPGLAEYFCTVSDSVGFRLQTHLPIDVPHVLDFGIAIKPNSEVFVSIRPEITMADPSIRDIHWKKRQCYFRNEFKLAYYNFYTSSNCFDECIANLTYKICECVRYYMPRDNTRNLCGPQNFLCAEDVRKASLSIGIQQNCSFCLPTCTELEYYSETTYSTIQDHFDIWVDDFNLTAEWANKNVSIVHVFFSSDSTYARVRKQLFGLVDLIANTGGLMGLCLGFSGLSLIEFIYFFTLRAWCRSRRRRTIWALIARKFHKFWIKNKS